MSAGILRNVATLVIAERADSENLYIRLTFEPEEGTDLEESTPKSFEVMKLLWDATLGGMVETMGEQNAPTTTTAQ